MLVHERVSGRGVRTRLRKEIYTTTRARCVGGQSHNRVFVSGGMHTWQHATKACLAIEGLPTKKKEGWGGQGTFLSSKRWKTITKLEGGVGGIMLLV